MTSLQSISIRHVFSRTFKAIALKPALIVPFLFAGLFNGLGLVLLYFAPRYPVSRFMGPPIRKFLGGEALQYPQNFNMMIKAIPYVSLFVIATVGIFLTAYSLKMLQSLLLGKRFSILQGLLAAITKYIVMVLVFLGVYFLIQFLVEAGISATDGIIKNIPIATVLAILVNLLIGVLLQSAFFFVFPSLVIGEKGFFRALGENFIFFGPNFVKIFGIVLIPTLLSLIPAYFRFVLPALIGNFDFEVILWVLSIGVLINVLIDILITLSSGICYAEMAGIGNT